MIKRNKKGQFVKGIYLGFGFKKGQKVWNKGKKGIHLSPKSEFKKGMVPHNKGKGSGWIDNGYRKIFNNTKEHRYIMEQYVDRKLESWEIVHHINGNRSDNRLANLEVTTQPEHIKIHKIWLKRKSRASA